MRRLWPWPLGVPVAAVVVGAVALATVRYAASQPSSRLTPAATQALAADTMTPIGGRPAPNFHLIDQNGRPVSLSAFRGKVVLLSFLDPVCWIDCPLQAHEMADLDRLLGPRLSGRVALVAVAANPMYHSVADVRQFLREQELTGVPNMTFATSPSLATLKRVWKDYYEEIRVVKDGMVDHTVDFWLIGPNGGEQYLSQPASNPEYVWGTSQLLATYIEHLLHTSAAFATDRPTPLPPTASVNQIERFGPVAVHFASPSQGWLVMDLPPYQVLYATADGGATWTNVGPPGVGKQAGLGWSWLSGSTAWVLVRPFVWARDTTAYLTTSAGRGWATPAMLPGAPAAQATVPLSGADATHAGLLLGDRLWVTTDGGRVWKPAATLPTGVQDPGLSWASGATAWLGGRSAQAGAARLWLASGGLAPWKEVRLPVPSRFLNAPVTTLPPRWQSAGSGLVAVVAQVGGHAWLWVDGTSDGGLHWHQALPPVQAAGHALGGGLQVAGDTVWALAGGPHGVTVLAGDARTGTWTQAGTPLPASLAGARVVDFLNPQDGWLVAGGADGTALYQTRDGGTTWAPVHLPCRPSPNPVGPDGGCPAG